MDASVNALCGMLCRVSVHLSFYVEVGDLNIITFICSVRAVN